VTLYRRTAALAPLVAAVAVAVAVVASCAAPGSTPPGPGSRPAPTGAAPRSSAPVACPQQGVVIRIGAVDGAMGLRVLSVEMTNCADRPYTVDGYPVVRVLDGDRKPIDVEIGLGTSTIIIDPGLDAAPQPVTLPPGGEATDTVVWRNLVTDATVVATTGTYLQIAPAGGQPSQIVSPRGGIDLGNTGKLGVGSWRATEPTGPAVPPTEPTGPAVPPTVPAVPPGPPGSTPPPGR
jgi:hypothetical protein